MTDIEAEAETTANDALDLLIESARSKELSFVNIYDNLGITPDRREAALLVLAAAIQRLSENRRCCEKCGERLPKLCGLCACGD